jgi:hypothetical protein
MTNIDDPAAVRAMIDLVAHSAFALPSSYSRRNPLGPTTWEDLTLGGEYVLMPDAREVFVMLELSLLRDGYLVERGWIASAAEKRRFLEDLDEWKHIVPQAFGGSP